MGLLKKIGKAFNDIMGTTSNAEQQNSAQMQLQHDAQNFAKWQMQNAHQAEVADLEKAGINPVMTSGGTGAGASVTEGSAQTGHGTDPATLLSTLMSAKKIDAEVDNIDAQTRNIDADTDIKGQTLQWTPKLNQAVIDLQNAQSGKARQETIESIAKTTALQFQNQMSEMDYDKRKRNFGKELDIYKKQLELKLIELGIDQSTSGQVVKAVGKWVNALSPFTEFTGKSISEQPQYSTHYHYN